MPWVVRDTVRDINRAVARRWQALDPLLPDPSSLPAGCGQPLVVNGGGGRVTGIGVCVHQQIPAESLNQTWGPADRFTLVPRLAGNDISAGTDELLTAWRDHLAGIGAARGADAGASAVWPSHDVTGVSALLRHGLQPLTVIAARTRPGNPAGPGARRNPPPGVTIRAAGPEDADAVLSLELNLIRFDMQFGGPVWRPRTQALVRADIADSLRKQANWTWLALRHRRPVGLLVAQPPGESGWISGMTSRAPAAYLQTMFIAEAERGTGVGSALVRVLHERLDADGVAVTLLHHSQVNPLSGPFWNRMGYRPLWTSWEARPATALR
ncbi:MAG: GNAT family N-acetyltransferase [Streptosporangiales bacterium]|nr:GNAT family N-acetyltransferase [Streptosporangiales bacterium]